MFTSIHLWAALIVSFSVLVYGRPRIAEYIIFPQATLSLEERNALRDDIRATAEDGRAYTSLANKEKPLWKFCTARLSDDAYANVRARVWVCIH